MTYFWPLRAAKRNVSICDLRAKRPVTFQSRGNRFLVTDLAEGDWQVLRDGAVAGPTVRVTGEEGALWFEGRPGSYTLRP